MKKRCKECGGMYETEDQKVILSLNHKDIESIEERLFTSAEPTIEDKKRVHKFWKQLCDQEEKWKK
ncbi:MAG TPA: hypothetical protein VJH20_00270 [Candidatus Nanoarchaeia archaeon]|nr:hypothetical protein [Candidatus Nanoarchaeia archaeon]